MPAESSSRAVFLSYASQDAPDVRRIADALRAAQVEVWFDQSELRGGDAWDAKIRGQIKECALFMPVISANTQARREGYFRIEWKLAAQRTHAIADGTPFLLPIVLGEVPETQALVPAEFREVQWTRLKLEETPTTLAARVRAVLSNGPEALAAPERAALPERKRPGRLLWSTIVPLVGVAVGVIFLFRPFWGSGSESRRRTAADASRAEKRNQTSPQVEEVLGRVYAILGKFNYTRDSLAVAEDLSRRATELGPDSAPAWAARAFVNASFLLRGWDRSVKRRQETESFANRSLTIDPQARDALTALVVLHNVQGAYAQAEVMARRALTLHPEHVRLHEALAGAISGQNRTEEAIALRRHAAAKFPREPLVHYGLANELVRMADFAGAWESVTAALAIEPFTSALLLKAQLEIGWKGDLAGARATMDAIAPEERTEIRAVGVAMWLSLLERRPERVQAAAALTTQTYLTDNVTVANGPKSLPVALALELAANHTLARQQWQLAETAARLQLRAEPADWMINAYIAVALAGQGRGEEAAREISLLEATIAEQNRYTAARAIAAQYYALMGDAAKAVYHLREGVGRRLGLTGHTLALDPWWDKIRAAPEFQALLAEAKTPGAVKKR
jgi:Tfp pilus assembly protein PilF